jgi:2-methylcitrate dehydratase PrpD
MSIQEIDRAAAGKRSGAPEAAASDARPGPTKALARFVATLAFDDLDETALYKARCHTLDTIGVCLAGGHQDVSRIAASVLEDLTAPGAVSVPGLARRTDALSAAFLAGTAGHGLELDDGFRAGAIHPGCVVIPAALAMGHVTGADGKRFLAAIAAGYEVAARLAALVHPRPRWRGFHNTATIGVFAAAAVTAVLKGHDAAVIESAFGLAASSASGIRSYVRGGDVKRIHPGLASRDGILAALLAAKGHLGAPDVLEGKDGFFHAFAGEDGDFAGADVFAAGGQLNSRFAVADCYIKPHACCRHLHPAIDALIDILSAEDLAPEEVTSVDVATYKVAATHGAIGWTAMTTAQMSFPFALAAALQHRAVHLHHFGDEGRRDRDLLRHCAKVRVSADDALDATYPKKRPARVTVTTAAGRQFVRMVDEPLGSATNPLPDAQLREKFHALADPVIGADRAAGVARDVWALERMANVRGFVESLAG